MSTDPNREIVIRSVRRSWALLMKRLIHLSAEEEQPFPAAGGGGCGDSLGVPSTGIWAAIFLPGWRVLSLEAQAGLEEKRRSVVSGKLDVVVFLAGICPRGQELGELLSGAENHPRKGFLEPSSESLIFLMLSLMPVLGCSAQAHLGSAAGPVPQPSWLPQLAQTPLSQPRGHGVVQTHLTQLWRSTEHPGPSSVTSAGAGGWNSRGLPLLCAVGVLGVLLRAVGLAQQAFCGGDTRRGDTRA